MTERFHDIAMTVNGEALHERVEAERAVLPENDFAHEEVPQCIVTERLDDRVRADNVPARF